MTNESFDEAMKYVQNGDWLAVQIDENAKTVADFLGINIQNFSGPFAHIEQVIDKDKDITFTAQPPKLCYEKLSRYRGQPGVELYFLRLIGVTPEQVATMAVMAKSLEGVRYNIGLDADLLARYSTYQIPILGYFIRKFHYKDPMPNKLDLKGAGIVCSTAASIVARSVRPEFLAEFKDVQTITPSIFFDADELDIVARCVEN